MKWNVFLKSNGIAEVNFMSGFYLCEQENTNTKKLKSNQKPIFIQLFYILPFNLTDWSI